jgi:CheY-like chemotaxis protein
VGANRRILIVESNDTNRQVLGELLSGEACVVDLTSSAQTALDRFKAAQGGPYSALLIAAA